MSRTNEVDQAIRDAIAAALAAPRPESDGHDALADRVAAAVIPLAGAAAQRRRTASMLRSAFKDGFMGGRAAGRFARWHGLIWTQSATARSLRQPTRDEAEAQSRFAGYNYE